MERDLRLDDVVARTERILGRIEQREDAPSLVVVQHAPERRQAGKTGEHHAEQGLPADAGEEDDPGARGGDQQRRAALLPEVLLNLSKVIEVVFHRWRDE